MAQARRAELCARRPASTLCVPKPGSLSVLQIPTLKIIPACLALAGPDTDYVLKAKGMELNEKLLVWVERKVRYFVDWTVPLH